MGSKKKWWQGKMKKAGLRLTAPRLSIIDVLIHSDNHPSAEEIYLALRRQYKKHTIGLTTIYRTLDILVQLGIVYKFDFGDGRTRYELSEGPNGFHHHHHLVCNGCGHIVDYTDFIDEEKELLDRTEKGLAKKYNFSIHHHLIQFYGLCEHCR